MSGYNLSVISKIALSESKTLIKEAYDLGSFMASKNCRLLSIPGFNLSYKTAQGISAKSGISIGFSLATNYRSHINDKQLPTDVYDFIHFNPVQLATLETSLITNSQALILIGSSPLNMANLYLSLELMLPVGILVSQADKNNNLIKNLGSLNESFKERIVINDNPQELLNQLIKILDGMYTDLNDSNIKKSNDFFENMFDQFCQN